jgi:tellurite resistance protein TerC
VQRLVYLSYGLAFILAFIGVKLFLHALHENELPFINGGEHVAVPEINTLLSLGVIIVTLAITTVASLYKTRNDSKKDVDADSTVEPTENSAVKPAKDAGESSRPADPNH